MGERIGLPEQYTLSERERQLSAARERMRMAREALAAAQGGSRDTEVEQLRNEVRRAAEAYLQLNGAPEALQQTPEHNERAHAA